MLDSFSTHHKTQATYLDVAANSHGREKGRLLLRALERTRSSRPHAVEIGPGGGAAVAFLAQQLTEQPDHQPVDLTLIEAPGVTSESLTTAMGRFEQVGTATLRHGLAGDLPDLITDPVDVIEMIVE